MIEPNYEPMGIWHQNPCLWPKNFKERSKGHSVINHWCLDRIQILPNQVVWVRLTRQLAQVFTCWLQYYKFCDCSEMPWVSQQIKWSSYLQTLPLSQWYFKQRELILRTWKHHTPLILAVTHAIPTFLNLLTYSSGFTLKTSSQTSLQPNALMVLSPHEHLIFQNTDFNVIA